MSLTTLLRSIRHKLPGKRCPGCGETDLSKFGPKGAGYQSYCRACNKAYQVRWYAQVGRERRGWSPR